MLPSDLNDPTAIAKSICLSYLPFTSLACIEGIASLEEFLLADAQQLPQLKDSRENNYIISHLKVSHVLPPLRRLHCC